VLPEKISRAFLRFHNFFFSFRKLGDNEGGARTIEIGPIRNQNSVKIDEGQQKIKIVRTNQQSNLRVSCQSIFSLSLHHPSFPPKLRTPQSKMFASSLSSLKNMCVERTFMQPFIPSHIENTQQ